MLEDKWLISRARQGDGRAWERIYLKYRHVQFTKDLWFCHSFDMSSAVFTSS
jgi:hypothetical protein